MNITRDWLNRITGILSLAFGIYCLIIAIGITVFQWTEISFVLMFFCILFGVIYIIYGISALLTRAGQMSSFVGVGFIIGSFWWSPELPWFMWPMIIMPIIIMLLTVIIIFRHFFRSKKAREWD